MASTSISPYSLLPSLLPLSSPCFPTLSTRRPCRPLLVGRKPHPISASSPKNNPDNTTTNGSWVSPNWLTSLVRSLALGRGDDSGIPIANAKLEDVSDLLGGALFLPLFKWMLEYGPVYRLAAGPRDFVVVSDPAIAKHVLRNYGKYAKGLVSEVSEFLFGSGFAVAEGPLWTVRRRAVAPSLHKKYLSIMVDKVFCRCAQRLVGKLQTYAENGEAVNMEENFSQLTLDVIGMSLFNYNFDSLTSDSPVIDAVYTALKEAEARSTDILPYWKAGFTYRAVRLIPPGTYRSGSRPVRGPVATGRTAYCLLRSLVEHSCINPKSIAFGYLDEKPIDTGLMKFLGLCPSALSWYLEFASAFSTSLAPFTTNALPP
ncbi:hypothetical protein GW17_00058904 [Ensete ventricosum]|nr:hypothetical protein GW17_00058904 [Ensete ventricosum]